MGAENQVLAKLRDLKSAQLAVPVVCSCEICHGSQKCHFCSGRGVDSRFGVDAHGNAIRCGFCSGRGRCSGCREHIDGLARFRNEIGAGQFALAESTIQVHLQKVNERELRERTFDKAVAVGGLALTGALLFSGLGLVAGALGGGLLSENRNVKTIPHIQEMRANLFFCLGLVYALQQRNAEARQAWIKARTMCDTHEPTIRVLKELR